jgi:hypothetical protein
MLASMKVAAGLRTAASRFENNIGGKALPHGADGKL